MVKIRERIKIGPAVLRKRYSLRRTGANGLSFETTIPREVIEREARMLQVPVGRIDRETEIEWRYDDFRGLHMILVPKASRRGRSK